MQEVPSEYKEKLPYFDGDKALEEAAQKRCGVSFPEDTQKHPGHDPVKTTLRESV